MDTSIGNLQLKILVIYTIFIDTKTQQQKLDEEKQATKKPASTSMSASFKNKNRNEEIIIVRLPHCITERLSWNSPKKLKLESKQPEINMPSKVEVDKKVVQETVDSGGSSAVSTPQSTSKYDPSKRMRDERASTPDNFRFVQLRKVQRVQKPVEKRKFNGLYYLVIH